MIYSIHLCRKEGSLEVFIDTLNPAKEMMWQHGF